MWMREQLSLDRETIEVCSIIGNARYSGTYNDVEQVHLVSVLEKAD